MPFFAPARPGLGVWHPASLVATWFGFGRMAHAPGTWGSAAALPCAWVISRWGGSPALAAAAALCAVVGWWAAAAYVRRTGIDDPKEVVVDEVAGQWLVLAAAPLDPVWYAAGFALFRLFDIWKPWPVRLADRHVGGGLGVMLDDLLAAAYGAALLALAVWWWGELP